MKGLTEKKEVKLYNVLFPFWFLLLIPSLWFIVLPGNFIIDSLVLIISMYVLKIADKKQFYKNHIFKIYIFGMLSDIVGSAFLLLMLLLELSGPMGDAFYITLPAVIISAVLIFVLNYFFTFKKAEGKLRFKMAMIFAIATAPYTFMIPSSLLYGI